MEFPNWCSVKLFSVSVASHKSLCIKNIFRSSRFKSENINCCKLISTKSLNGKLLKAKDKNTRRDIRKELKALSKEERKRQLLVVADVIKSADVVLTTLIGASPQKLDRTSFDLVIIDEAAQAFEISCWIALLKVNEGSRCVLAGDHLQLPPTIQSTEGEKKGLGRTLFECLADLYGDMKSHLCSLSSTACMSS